jgi:hypothetical protein
MVQPNWGNGSQPNPSKAGLTWRSPGVLVALGGGAILVVGSVAWSLGEASKRARTPAASASAGVPAVSAELPVVPIVQKKETPSEAILKIGNFGAARDYAKPFMTDEANNLSPGAAIFALWAAQSMHYYDVGVAKDETTYALVRKDSDEARGKRLCATGMLIQIEVQKSAGSKFFDGLLITDGGSIFRFLTVGSSGDLVERSRARVCGVVIGTYDYSNSGGGTGHAVQLVGMFDLPENHGR